MFLLGLILGVVLGTIVVAFLALGAYERGYAAARDATWRVELRARRSRARRPGVIAA